MVKKIFMLLVCSTTLQAHFPKKMLINVPVCDVRRLPVPGTTFDKYQETQLLLGDRVVAHEEHDGFLRINALDQGKYPGWIRSDVAQEVPSFPKATVLISVPHALLHTKKGDHYIPGQRLSIGTKLAVEVGLHWSKVMLPGNTTTYLPNNQCQDIHESLPSYREYFCSIAQSFVGQAYCWGGCSGPSQKLGIPSGVDCSGLVYLSARACGIELPRNARDQYKATKATSTLQCGDLIFRAPASQRDNIDHVLIYLGDGRVLEASGKGKNTGVRITPFSERFGRPLAQVCSGNRMGGSVLYFRTLPFKD